MQKKQNVYYSDTSVTNCRKSQDAELQEANRYSSILNSMPTGYAFCRAVYHEGTPVDLVYEEVNSAYESITGLKNVSGRRLTGLLPAITRFSPELFAKVLKVTETGISEKFESYAEGLNHWYEHNVYSPEKGSVVSIIEDITAKKLLEEHLGKNEDRLKTFFNSNSAIQVLLDPDTGQVLDINQSGADWYGWSVDEMKKMYTRDVNTLSATEIKKSLKTVKQGRQNIFTGRHRRADGSIRDVEIFRNKIVIDGKAVIHVIIHDITERIKTEEELKKSELRFRTLFSGHSAIMIVLDPESARIVDANQAAADFYGWSIDALKTMMITDLNTGTPAELRNEMDKWKKESQRHMAFRHRKADGSIRDVEIFGNKISINGKKLVYDIIQDVTVRNRLETVSQMRIRLLESAKSLSVNELLQTALDELEWLTESSLGFAFLLEENQTSFIYETYSTNSLLQHQTVPRKGEHFPLNNAGVWADAVRKRKAVIHNDYASIINRSGFPDGHVMVTREMTVPVVRNNKIVAIFGVGNKKSNYEEEELEWVLALADQAWEIIENKIKGETQKKIEAQLQHASKMEAIGQLASGISHEINNPLNFITINIHNQVNDFNDLQELVGDYRGIIDKLVAGSATAGEIMQLRTKEKELDIDFLIAQIPRTFQMTQQGVERITAITKSMRNFSFKNENGVLYPFDINTAIKESLILAKSELSNVATIDLQLKELPLVMCDPPLISQVILNLIVNSLHAIKSQNKASLGTICIKTWSSGENIFFSVTDNGAGMSEEVKKRIFEPFFTTKDIGQGTGLGLSLSYDIIVNKHKGSISADCPAEGGTVFTISLPGGSEE